VTKNTDAFNNEQRLAVINSKIFCATAEIQGMIAQNAQWARDNGMIAYKERDFLAITDKYKLNEDQVRDFLGRGE